MDINLSWTGDRKGSERKTGRALICETGSTARRQPTKCSFIDFGHKKNFEAGLYPTGSKIRHHLCNVYFDVNLKVARMTLFNFIHHACHGHWPTNIQLQTLCLIELLRRAN